MAKQPTRGGEATFMATPGSERARALGKFASVDQMHKAEGNITTEEAVKRYIDEQ
jgi:hypothetical protein